MICVFAGAQRPHFFVLYQSTNLSICQSLLPATANRLLPQIAKYFQFACVARCFVFEFEMSKLPATPECPPPLLHPLSRHGKWLANISSYFWPQANGLLQLSFCCCCSFFCCCCYCCFCFAFLFVA